MPLQWPHRGQASPVERCDATRRAERVNCVAFVRVEVGLAPCSPPARTRSHDGSFSPTLTLASQRQNRPGKGGQDDRGKQSQRSQTRQDELGRAQRTAKLAPRLTPCCRAPRPLTTTSPRPTSTDCSRGERGVRTRHAWSALRPVCTARSPLRAPLCLTPCLIGPDWQGRGSAEFFGRRDSRALSYLISPTSQRQTACFGVTVGRGYRWLRGPTMCVYGDCKK